jgi:RNA polymerase sigma-70 factor (ECF subfamily)
VDATTASGLFARHYRDVHRYLARMAGRPDVADDLAQEVFLRAVSALESDRQSIRHERGWIFAIARHLFLDYCRKEGTRAVAPAVGVEPVTDAGQDLAVQLAQALDRLLPPDRECFLLKEVGGLSYEEIASVCQCSTDSVRARLYRTRVALRGLLQL